MHCLTRPDRVSIYLQPGQSAFGGPRHLFSTLLGSCVSITLWHPAHRHGAMSHFLLPSRGGANGRPLDAHYGDEAICLMLRAFAAHGIDPAGCVAKVFGGGRMFPGQDATLAVGRRNGQAARAMLQAYGIVIASEDLYGAAHRKIVFDVQSGDVWVRQERTEAGAQWR